MIRGTFCDLAVKIDGKIRLLIEVKAAGVDLNESHLRQAVNYAANEGIEWVALTNGIMWRLFRVKFTQPINTEEIVTFSLLNLNPKTEEDQRRLFLFSREGMVSDAMNLFHQHASILNPYTVAQIISQESTIGCIRRELRKIFPDIKVTPEDLAVMLKNSILKREVVEGDKAAAAALTVKKAITKIAKQTAKKSESSDLAPSIPDKPDTIENFDLPE